MIEYSPQPIEKLRARYKKAISVTWIMAPDMKEKPDQQPENIFDTEDGLRLIIYRELTGNDLDNVIFCGMYWEDVYKPKELKELYDRLIAKFMEITDQKRDRIQFSGFRGDFPSWKLLRKEEQSKAMEGHNEFDLEFQWRLYLSKLGLSEEIMHPVRLQQTKMAFYGAWGSLLNIIGTQFTKIPKDTLGKIIGEMTEQVNEFWKYQASQNPPKS